jgi:amidohydrolase
MIKKEILNSVDSIAPLLKDFALELHNNPELGLEEFKAVRRQIELFRNWGFEVTAPFAGLETAYKATFGTGKPVFCFMAEYDALPELGHACGHNLIATAAVGAGKALADILQTENIPGTVMVMGTPAEEGKGGKVRMMEKNALDGIDAVIIAHPSESTTTWPGCMGVERFDLKFKGKASHAAKAPEDGKNALDAVILFFQGINAWRQHLPEKTRVHGIITDGGVLPNIVPDKASAAFYLRADNTKQIEKMIRRCENIAKGAALMTDCDYEIEFRKFGYKSGLPNGTLNSAFFEYTSALEMKPQFQNSICRASTDFGNVSHEVPGIQPYFGIVEGDEHHSLHTTEFAEDAKSDYAVNQTIKMAQAMAMVGYRFLTDQKFRTEITDEFARQKSLV